MLSPPDASMVPSGENATAWTQSVCPLRGVQPPPARDIPQDYGVIISSGREQCAVGRKRHGLDSIHMSFEDVQLPPLGNIPQGYGVIISSGREQCAVG